jgi:hypothetical protein
MGKSNWNMKVGNLVPLLSLIIHFYLKRNIEGYSLGNGINLTNTNMIPNNS